VQVDVAVPGEAGGEVGSEPGREQAPTPPLRDRIAWGGWLDCRSMPHTTLATAIGLVLRIRCEATASADLDGGFVEGELVRPGREARVSAVGVQPAHDRQQCVVCRLNREVVEVFVDGASTAGGFEAGGAQEQRVQALDGVLASGSRAGERPMPVERLGVGDRELRHAPIVGAGRTQGNGCHRAFAGDDHAGSSRVLSVRYASATLWAYPPDGPGKRSSAGAANAV
jgi:hypothetical protein